MFRKTVSILSTIIFAFVILSVSLIKSAQVNYTFSGDVKALDLEKTTLIDYELAYPGKILPDSSLWIFKAARDKTWLWLTTDESRKAELFLLFADKRLGSAKVLFESNKPERAFSTLTKSGKYLEAAAMALEENTKSGMNTVEFAKSLSKASLKHKEVIKIINEIAPEDAKPKINEVENYAKNAFKTSRDILRSFGEEAPESPLDWD